MDITIMPEGRKFELAEGACSPGYGTDEFADLFHSHGSQIKTGLIRSMALIGDHINFPIEEESAPYDVRLGGKPMLGNICFRRVA